MLRLTINEGHFREAAREGLERFATQRSQASNGGSYDDHNVVINVPVRVDSDSPHIYERFRQHGETPHVHFLLQFNYPEALYTTTVLIPEEVARQVVDQREVDGLVFEEITDDNRVAFAERLTESYLGTTISNETVRIRFH